MGVLDRWRQRRAVRRALRDLATPMYAIFVVIDGRLRFPTCITVDAYTAAARFRYLCGSALLGTMVAATADQLRGGGYVEGVSTFNGDALLATTLHQRDVWERGAKR